MSTKRLYLSEGWESSKYHYYYCLAEHWHDTSLGKPYIDIVKGSKKGEHLKQILKKVVLKDKKPDYSFPSMWYRKISIFTLNEEETKYFLIFAKIFRAREFERKIWERLSKLDEEELKRKLELEYVRLKLGGK